MTPIFGEEAYRLPGGAGRGTVGTVRALRALLRRVWRVPHSTLYKVGYTMCRPSVFPSAEAW
jgi:hypothetical protein